MRVNIAQFKADLPGKISIARSMPGGMDLPELKLLAPSRELFAGYKRGAVSWDDYVRIYWNDLAGRCKTTPAIWNAARVSVADGKTAYLRQGCLLFILSSAARTLGVDEVTICCWEAPDNPKCHRKLIYDALSESVQGLRL